jgi:sortase A
MRRWIANLLLIAGAAAVGAWAWSNIRGAIYQRWENQAFERALRDHPAPSVGNRAASPQVTANGGLVGRLLVPRLRLRAIVREGAGEDVLGVALGHITGTALPGQNGNVGVAGHRDTFFRGLRKIRKNDLIQFQTTGGDFFYRVQATGVVPPRDISVLKAGQSPSLTLVTCYPFNYIGSAPDRFIVKAVQVVQVPLRRQSAATGPRRAAGKTGVSFRFGPASNRMSASSPIRFPAQR